MLLIVKDVWQKLQDDSNKIYSQTEPRSGPSTLLYEKTRLSQPSERVQVIAEQVAPETRSQVYSSRAWASNSLGQDAGCVTSGGEQGGVDEAVLMNSVVSQLRKDRYDCKLPGKASFPCRGRR